jgi:hypothetical protein
MAQDMVSYQPGYGQGMNPRSRQEYLGRISILSQSGHDDNAYDDSQQKQSAA